jgi:hypothetical protein
MSAGWQVGDLALNVGRVDGVPIGPPAKGFSKPRKGRIYNVEGVITHKGEIGLIIEGHPSSHGTTAWHHAVFRKIKPDTEPCEEEFALLIKRKVGT